LISLRHFANAAAAGKVKERGISFMIAVMVGDGWKWKGFQTRSI